MERIIKLFRRVMLAVVIIPFLSVFAMPDYSVHAAEGTIYNGSESISVSSLPISEPEKNNFGSGKIWCVNHGVWGSSLHMEGVTLSPNSEGIVMKINGFGYWDGDCIFISHGENTIKGKVQKNGGYIDLTYFSGDSWKLINLTAPSQVVYDAKQIEIVGSNIDGGTSRIQNQAHVVVNDGKLQGDWFIDNGTLSGSNKLGLLESSFVNLSATPYSWFANYSAAGGAYQAGGMSQNTPIKMTDNTGATIKNCI